ncbi:MAG: ABC transporter ATP-binding protein/permease [Lachnospiraceae bacterium]|nr:ABC transporter ATP-binding protein/permease [Lachnospiraceae bacterium]
MEKEEKRDQLTFKQEKGTWKRFMYVMFHGHLPWISIVVYIIAELFFINLGVDETDLTAQLFAGDVSVGLVTKLIGIMVLNLVLANLVVLISGVTTAKMNRNMREVLTKKILKLPMSFFREENPREAIYRVVNNSTVVSDTIMLVVLPIAFVAYQAVLVFSMVFSYDWRLSVILIAFIPLQVFMAFIFGRINFSVSERESFLHANLTQRLAEMITNIPLAKAFAREDRESKEGNELIDRLYKISIKGSWIQQIQNLSETAVALIQAVVITLVGALLLRNGGISTENWIRFFMFSSTFAGAIEEFMMYWGNLKVIQGTSDRVAEIMYAQVESEEGEAIETPLSGDIEVKNISFGYSEEGKVFSDASAIFPANSKTALLGVSGSGKTTLLNLIMRLYEPENGEVSIGGKNIKDYALADYRKQFVMVAQDEMIFSGTIRENIAYGYENVTDEDIIEALKKSGAYEFVQQFPEGLDALLSEYGSNLSGGQRQRLSLARAYLSDAPYIILDEPAAALDAYAVGELINAIKGICEHKTLIVIGHSPCILPLVDRVVVIEDGSVAAEGSVDEVKASNQFLREFAGGEA